MAGTISRRQARVLFVDLRSVNCVQILHRKGNHDRTVQGVLDIAGLLFAPGTSLRTPG